MSRPEAELTEIHQILMENLYHVSAALAAVEVSHSKSLSNIGNSGNDKGGNMSSTGGSSSTSTIKDTDS